MDYSQTLFKAVRQCHCGIGWGSDAAGVERAKHDVFGATERGRCGETIRGAGRGGATKKRHNASRNETNGGRPLNYCQIRLREGKKKRKQLCR